MLSFKYSGKQNYYTRVQKSVDRIKKRSKKDRRLTNYENRASIPNILLAKLREIYGIEYDEPSFTSHHTKILSSAKHGLLRNTTVFFRT